MMSNGDKLKKITGWYSWCFNVHKDGNDNAEGIYKQTEIYDEFGQLHVKKELKWIGKQFTT